jgi:hypothetical protein
MKKRKLITGSLAFGLFFCVFAGIGQSTVCFDLTITDNCFGAWNGYYTARVSVTMGGSTYCNHIFENLDDGTTNNLTYDCSGLPIDGTMPLYTVTVTVCRQEDNSQCCDSDTQGPFYYSRLDDCDIALSVTLN